MNLLAVIPAYNEAATIADVVRRAHGHVPHVVVVDDGSSDNTGDVARQAGATIVRHPCNRGKGAAILTGLQCLKDSRFDGAIFLDADGQHDPAEIPQFCAAAQASDVGIIIGNRMTHTTGMPWLRLWTNRVTSFITSQLAGQTIPDSQCGYRLIHRRVLPVLRLSTKHFETETEILIQTGRAGLRIVSVPIRTIYLPGRHSHIRPVRDTIRFIRLAVRYQLLH